MESLARLTGKVAFVTGATTVGIGSAIAKKLGCYGCSVIINGIGTDSAVNEIIEEFLATVGSRPEFIPGDLSKLSDVDKIIEEIDKRYPKGIDILVNNAGIGYVHLIEEWTREEYDYVMAVNLHAPFHFTQAFLPRMKAKKWGRIINISSVLGEVGMATKAPYCATKSALIGLSKAVALENAEMGVTVNCICPGSTWTPMELTETEADAKRKKISFDEAKRERIAELHPSKTYTHVDQIASMAHYLCTPAADNMTGTTIPIDGGFLAR